MNRFQLYVQLVAAVAAAAATALVSLATIDVPANFWSTTTTVLGHPGATRVVEHHAGLVTVVILIGFVTAAILAVISAIEARRYERQERARALDETLAWALTDISDRLQADYKTAVDKLLTSLAPDKALQDSVRANEVVSPSKIGIHLHLVRKLLFRKDALVPVGWFGLSQNLRELPTMRWRQSDDPLGTAWKGPSKAGARIGVGTGLAPKLPSQIAMAFPVRSSNGSVLGVLSVRGPDDANLLIKLQSSEAVDALVEKYCAMLIKDLKS
jgi:hypothetical protein